MDGVAATIDDGRTRALARRERYFGPSARSSDLAPVSTRFEDGTPVGSAPRPGQAFYYSLADTGRAITPEEARQAPTVTACRTLIAGSLARMEWRVIKINGRKREAATDHPLYDLLNRRPNPHIPAITLRESLFLDCLDYGNAFAYIERGRGNLEPVALHKLRADSMQVSRHPETNELVYWYTATHGGVAQPVPAWEILHIRGPSQDGLLGDAMPSILRNAIAIELDAQSYVASFFRNGARPGGLLTYPGKLEDDERKALLERWRAMVGGSRKAGSTGLLEGGVKWEKTATDPDEAQLIEARSFAREVICGAYHVPPHMIGDGKKQSYASAEQGAMEFVTFCLSPWAGRAEGEVAVKLLTGADGYETEISFEALLRGDLMSRMKAYAMAVTNGIATRNECRAKEGMPPVDGGDAISVPLNMATLDPDATKEGTPGPMVTMPLGIEAGAAPATPAPDTPDGASTIGTGAGGTTTVADTALNGAQVTALVEIVQAVKAGAIPLESGRAMVAASFPALTPAQVDAIFAPLAGVIGAAPDAPAPEPGAPGPPPVATDPNKVTP